MSNKTTKMKTYGSFSEWKHDQSATNQNLINALKDLIDETTPTLTTTVKWGQGCWTDNDTPKIYIHAEGDHVQLGFYNGSSLKDPDQLLSGGGKYIRFVKIYDTGDLDPKALNYLIKQATQ
jgi:hypothetical protein